MAVHTNCSMCTKCKSTTMEYGGTLTFECDFIIGAHGNMPACPFFRNSYPGPLEDAIRNIVKVPGTQSQTGSFIITVKEDFIDSEEDMLARLKEELRAWDVQDITCIEYNNTGQDDK